MEGRGGTSGDVLLYALEDLLEADFKRFKYKLAEINFKGQDNIPRGELEKTDRIDTKNLRLLRYGSDSAMDVTIEVFSKVGRMEAADRLREARKRGTFIKKHRLAFNKQMGNIKPMMEILQHKGVLQEEEVEDVLAERISRSQNSKLIQMVLNKGTESQEEFLRALQEKDPCLYNDLQKS